MKLIFVKLYIFIRILSVSPFYKYVYLYTLDFVSLFPFSSETSIPSIISTCLINGMLAQLAAATAANGTYLCKNDVEFRKKKKQRNIYIFFISIYRRGSNIFFFISLKNLELAKKYTYIGYIITKSRGRLLGKL